MKKMLTISLLLLVVLQGFTQADEERAPQNPKVREKIRAAHAAYITERLSLTTEEAEKFWPLYREYTKKRQALRTSFWDAKKSGSNEKELLELDLKIKQQELDLEKEYSQKFQQIIAPEKLINLKQAEADFRRLVLRQIQQRGQLRDRPRQRSR